VEQTRSCFSSVSAEPLAVVEQECAVGLPLQPRTIRTSNQSQIEYFSRQQEALALPFDLHSRARARLEPERMNRMAASDPRDNHSLFERLSREGDVEGLVELYAEDATYVAGPDQVLEGREQIRAALQSMIDMGYETRLELTGLVEAGDVVLEKSRWTTRVPDENGKMVEATGLSTVVLRRQKDGLWRMVIDDPGLG